MPNWGRNSLIYIAIMVVILIDVFLFQSSRPRVPEMPISQVAQDVAAGMVTSLTVQEDTGEVQVLYKAGHDPARATSIKERGSLATTLAQYGVSHEQIAAVDIRPAGAQPEAPF